MITKKPWFVTKLYGWGWTPATWQGWIILVLFALGIMWSFRRIDSMSHSDSNTLINFVLEAIFWSAALIGVCYLTGERPRWRWGK